VKQQETTDSVRIDKFLVEKIRQIAKLKGQTIAGYINVNLSRQVERDWAKYNEKINGLQQG
jgi:hypothetical protein